MSQPQPAATAYQSPKRDISAEVTVDDSLDEKRYKVVVVGDFGVGKTSIIKQLVAQKFGPQCAATIGVETHTKRVGSATLQLWDVAGQQYCGAMTKQYYRWASAAVVVCDVTRPSSFEAALEWKKDVAEKLSAQGPIVLNQAMVPSNNRNSTPVKETQFTSSSSYSAGQGTPIPIFLFVNKGDLIGTTTVTVEYLQQFAQKHGFVEMFVTTATEYASVARAFGAVSDKVAGTEPATGSNSPISAIDLSRRRKVKKSDKCC